MKKYEMPEIELKKFALEDVIATSVDECDDQDSTDWG